MNCVLGSVSKICASLSLKTYDGALYGILWWSGNTVAIFSIYFPSVVNRAGWKTKCTQKRPVEKENCSITSWLVWNIVGTCVQHLRAISSISTSNQCPCRPTINAFSPSRMYSLQMNILQMSSDAHSFCTYGLIETDTHFNGSSVWRTYN